MSEYACNERHWGLREELIVQRRILDFEKRALKQRLAQVETELAVNADTYTKFCASGMQLREDSTQIEAEAEGLQPDPKGDAQ